MTNTLFLVLFTIASMLAGPSGKVVTELMARGAIEQDTGVRHPAVSPGQPAALPGAPKPAAIVSILADAPSVKSETGPTAASPAVPARAGIQSPVADAGAELNAEKRNAGNDALPSPILLALASDTPNRRPDGAVFLPIAIQHLIGLRTDITKVGQFSTAVRIPGRIVTSRDVGALIQATQLGVMESAGGPLPNVGARVQKGQLLAYLRPIIDASKVAELNAKIAELKGLVDMGEQRIARLREVLLIRYRQSKIDAVQAEIDSDRRQLDIFQALLTDRTEIRARTSGVVSQVNFVEGQIVEPQARLFEIVDPTRLAVEAASFEPSLGDDIDEAKAQTPDGVVLPLKFVGGGLILQNQAVPLQFSISAPVPDVQIGEPVTVIVTRRSVRTNGIRLPASALLHSTSGESVVWEKLSAETFTTRPVAAQPLDGDTIIVTSGLAANMRIVTANSAILSQVR